MKILLLGEYSNVHWTLAEGLRALGHKVTVASNGDFWKNYPRDIDLNRTSNGVVGTVGFLARLACALPRMRNYDVVQLINPMFLEMKAEKIFKVYDYLRRHNGKVFMGAFGMDYYWVNECRTRKPLRYSDFNFGNELRTDEVAMREVNDWTGTAKEELNKYIAKDCDGIVAGLYEYFVCYKNLFADKLAFIPMPINLDKVPITAPPVTDKIKFFIGISKARSEYKGTDVMLRALRRIEAKYPDRVEVIKGEGAPVDTYKRLMDGSHVLLDQLYSYTPGMNGLLAMAKGLVLVGGGEEENYQILGDCNVRPIVNVLPSEDDVFCKLEDLVLQKDRLATLSRQSREYIERYHSHLEVAKQYIDLWTK